MRRWLNAAVFACTLIVLLPASGQQPPGFELARNVEERLRFFLAEKYCEGEFADVRYSAAQLRLGPDSRPLILVYIVSAGWCGSGGCDLSLYRDTGKSFSEAGEFLPVAKPPVGMLASYTNGWRDLVVGVHEGADGVFLGRARYVNGEYRINWQEYQAMKARSGLKDATTVFTSYGDKPLCRAQTSWTVIGSRSSPQAPQPAPRA